MNRLLDSFYLIVDSSNWIERLVPLGVKLVQLRIKNKDENFLRNEIRKAKAICTSYNCSLVINDYGQLAIEEGCSWVHLGQEDLKTTNLSLLRQAGLKIGISTHSLTELNIALKADPDYIALGPIYPTSLKKMPYGPQGTAKLTEWREKIFPLPLVAIGGLTLEVLSDVFDAGANSAAVVSDILQHPSPKERTLQWIQKTRFL